jgi:hypothetical protein
LSKELLRPLLLGGDRRSIANARQALTLVRADPARIDELAKLTSDEDPLVVQRATDLLEKLAHENPNLVAPHKELFVGPLADSDRWEVRLQIVRALPLFRWSPKQIRRVREILLRDSEHPQTFVKAWALDSLATFALADVELLPIVEQRLREFEQSDSKVLAARARNIRKRLAESS